MEICSWEHWRLNLIPVCWSSVNYNKWLPCRYLVVDLLFFVSRISLVNFLSHDSFSYKAYSICYSYFRTRFFPDEGPLFETLIFFEISYCSYQPFNSLPFVEYTGKLEARLVVRIINIRNWTYKNAGLPEKWKLLAWNTVVFIMRLMEMLNDHWHARFLNFLGTLSGQVEQSDQRHSISQRE